MNTKNIKPLTAEETQEILELARQGMTQKEIAKKYGRSQSTICHVINNEVMKQIQTFRDKWT